MVFVLVRRLRNILSYQPEARFIVMVQNPVEMAPALHGEMLFSGHENVHDFSAARDLQDERRQGRQLPPFSWGQRRFLYGEAGALGAQLERLLSAVPANRVLVLVLDDVAADPRREYLRALQFRGLNDDARVDFIVCNKAKKLRWPILTRAMFDIVQIKRRMGIELGLSLWDRFSDFNTIEVPRARLSLQIETVLRNYFANDIELLGRVAIRRHASKVRHLLPFIAHAMLLVGI